MDSERTEKDVLESGVKGLGSKEKGLKLELETEKKGSVYAMLSSTISHLSITTLHRVDKERHFTDGNSEAQ